MKKLLALLLFVPTIASAASISFTWDANTEPNLSGYKLYCSPTNVQPFTLVSSTITNSITSNINVESSIQYCAVTAYNDYNLESVYSNVVTLQKMVVPAAPVTFKKK